MTFGVEGVPGWGPEPPAEKVLHDIARAGYAGTELGPWGYLPREPDALSALLRRFGLALTAAFVALDLAEPDAWCRDLDALERVAALLAATGGERILLADSGDESSGPSPGAHGASVAQGLAAAAEVCARHGLAADLHPEVGSAVATREDIQRVLDGVAPERLGLCLDTGHLAYAGEDPLEALVAWGPRVRHVHLKDVSRDVLDFVRAHGLDFTGAVARGVFVPLGTGDVPLAAVVRRLEATGYDGWLIVEQDVILRPWDDPAAWAGSGREFLRRMGV